MTTRRLLLIATLPVLAAGVLALALRPHMIHGTVTDATGPVAGATVRLRGSLDSTTTDAAGGFALTFRGPALHRVVTAWKEGYYPAGADLSVHPTPSTPPSLRGKGDGGLGQSVGDGGLGQSVGDGGLGQSVGDGGLGLTLKPHPTADDPTYRWLTSKPDPNVALGCGNCHTNYGAWQQDAHALSATNPRFLSIYNGTDLAGQLVAGPGFRLDSPREPGNCAACHAPAAALAHGGRADMNQLSGVEAEGVLCDLCHKINGVLLDARSGLPYQGLPGVQGYLLQRPASDTQIFFGTLGDIPSRVSTLQLEKESRFCAPCHSGGWWGVSAYASYDEWLASPYAAEGVTCQVCHMPAETQQDRIVPVCPPASRQSAADLAAQPASAGFHLPEPVVSTAGDLREAFCRIQACVDCHLKPADPAARDPLAATALIPDRPPKTLHTHRMAGVADEAFMRSAVAMTVTARQGSDGVLVDVAITNVAAGHHIPTDSPLRNMILVVTARDAQGHTLAYLGDQVVPPWGGEGAVEAGNYAGLPGKGFAKVLEDWGGSAPAPQWRNGVRILSDTRIPARATDVSRYAFAAPPSPDDSILGGAQRSRRTSSGEGGRGGEVTVTARLIFRRAFKPWMDAKGWNEPDLLLAEAKTTAVDSAQAAPTAAPATPAPLFPPSLATTADGQRLRSADFAAPQDCIACHTDAGGAWQVSGHAEATSGPLYRAWFKAADQTTQGQISPFCAGCHTPIGLLSGQIRSRWAWSGRELYPLDAAAQGGVTCAVCHALTPTGVGNATYVADPTAILGTDHTASRSIPMGRSTQHAIDTRQSAIRNPSACAPCHEATNPGSGLPVMTTYSEWQRSPFNTGDPATETTCQDCHFVGGRHGGLRPEDLTKAARIEILPPGKTAAGGDLELKVRVTNVGAGHALPTGAAELRKVWLAVAVTDASGQELFSSGGTDAYGDPVAGSVIYGVTWQDAAGLPTDRLWEAERLLSDYRIPAGGTITETYRFPLPPGAQRPFHVRAALNYRASAGYLGALMTTYLGEEAPSASAFEMAVAEKVSD